MMADAAANGVPWHAVREVACNPQTKFVKLFNPIKKQEKTGNYIIFIAILCKGFSLSIVNGTYYSGIGIKKEAKNIGASVSSDDPRVYVNNLPSDITEEEIGTILCIIVGNILFHFHFFAIIHAIIHFRNIVWSPWKNTTNQIVHRCIG